MHFIVTFGFLIPVRVDAKIDRDERAGKGKIKKKREQSKKLTIIKNTSEIVESKKNVITVGEVLAEIHVEYELLPGYTFKFDCRCWEMASKIYIENDDWCLRPILCPNQENNVWVIFSVHHIVHLNEIHLEKFFNYLITYHIFSGRNKFYERTKRDKVRQFYIDGKSMNIEQNVFLEIYSSELYKSDSTIKLKSEPTVVKYETDEFSITSYVDAIPDIRHQYKFWKMLKKQRFPSESVEIDFIPSTDVKTNFKLKNQKTVKRPKKEKSKRETVQKMSLPANTLFSDMGTITCYTRTSQIPNITSSLIYTQCNDILSNKGLRRKLNPISIKLEQMSNFPYDIVIKSGFNYLYAKIMFVDQTIMTPYYIPTRTIYFEFMKCFLNEEFQATELISFLGTKLLTVEIIGIRRKNVAKPLVSVSQKPGTKKSVKEPDTHEKEDVLLCFASFDVSDLLRGLWEVRLIGSVSQPNNMHCVSINDNNAENDQKNSPLTNDILTLFGTTIKIKVHVACDLHVVHNMVLRHFHTFNRIFLILHEYELANSILADVCSHNCSLFRNLPSLNDGSDLKVEEATKNILTGFAIDANDQYYIFLEGLANGYLLKIWEKIAKLSNEEGYVFYNSTCVFLTRLYTDFMPLGGFLTLKLSESLETELLHHGLYIGKTGKTFRANVLRTIGLMKLTSTMTSLSQKCLLPNTTAVKYLFHEIGKHYFENFALKSEE